MINEFFKGYKGNMMGAARGTGTIFPSGAPEFTPSF